MIAFAAYDIGLTGPFQTCLFFFNCTKAFRHPDESSSKNNCDVFFCRKCGSLWVYEHFATSWAFFLPLILSMSLNYSVISLLENYCYPALATLLFGYILFRQLKKGNPKGLPLPPGPKGYPLIGNLFDLPTVTPCLVYEEWCNTYGTHFDIY